MAGSKKTEEADFDDVLDSLNKKHGLKAGTLSSILETTDALPTGNFVIDYVLGVGGLPRGRVIESYGTPSSGKTTMAVQAAALLQKQIIKSGSSDRIVYADFENAFDPDYAESLGLDPEHSSFIITQPNNLEQGTGAILDLVRTNKVRYVVVDSVAAMVPQAEIEGDMENLQVALQARLLTKFLRILSPLARQNDCTVVFINHSKEKIDMSGRGRPGVVVITTPGGVGLKFYSSVRIEFKQIGNVSGKAIDPISGESVNIVAATNVQVKTTKNKCARPFTSATVRVKFGHGFDEMYSALQVLKSRGVIHGSSGYHYFDRIEAQDLVHSDMAISPKGWPNFRSESDLLTFAEENPDWSDKFVNVAKQLVLSGSVIPETEKSVEQLLEGDPFDE